MASNHQLHSSFPHRLKLDEAARRAATLGAALRGAEAERDAAVAREREALRGAMAEAQQAQHNLVLQLQAKEEALAAALEQAKVGGGAGSGLSDGAGSGEIRQRAIRPAWKARQRAVRPGWLPVGCCHACR